MTESPSTLALLKYLGALLGPDDPGPATDILHELARLLAARGAGMAYPARAASTGPLAWIGTERAASFPWLTGAAELQALAERGEPAALKDADSSWLLWFAPQAPPTDPAVLWLNG